ncbi:MAG: AAA family ATPase [Candidatus Bipolaricaulota bacterium]|nr:AAA family ATPase [Candidatus Bipolaricaulota bacterium]
MRRLCQATGDGKQPGNILVNHASLCYIYKDDRAPHAPEGAHLSEHFDKLVILDELHRVPGLFPMLRGLIDRARRQGKRTGLYLLLGSTSLGLLRQSGESLAGRVRYLELTPSGRGLL